MRSPPRATSVTGSRCGRGSCPSPSPRPDWSALVAGALLGSFSLRAESALIDPGLDHADGGFFGRRDPDTGPMPAAEAETEKLPAQRPDLHPDEGPPDRS